MNAVMFIVCFGPDSARLVGDIAIYGKRLLQLVI